MKKIFIFLIGMVMLTACCGQPSGAEEAVFTTIGEAVNSSETDRAIGGTEDQYIVVLKNGKTYLRIVADMDEKAKELYEATLTADDVEKAIDDYIDYMSTLPVAYTEEITAKPLDQEYLDTLVGKTMGELEELGFEAECCGSVDTETKQYKDYMAGEGFSISYGENSSTDINAVGASSGENTSEKFVPEVEFTMSNGLYLYHFFAAQTAKEFLEMDSDENLVAVTAAFSGISPNASQLKFHADGEVERDQNLYTEYATLLEDLDEAVTNAIKDGSTDVEALTEEMVKLFPDYEADVRALVPILYSLTTGEPETAEMP